MMHIKGDTKDPYIHTTGVLVMFYLQLFSKITQWRFSCGTRLPTESLLPLYERGLALLCPLDQIWVTLLG